MISSDLPPRGWITEQVKPIKDINPFLMYHRYIRIVYDSDIHDFVVDRSSDYDILTKSRKVLVVEKESSTILFIDINDSEFMKCIRDMEFVEINEESVQGYTHRSYKFKTDYSKYNEIIPQKVIYAINNIARVIDRILLYSRIEPYVISVSDVHGDILLYLLPLFLSKTVINLEIKRDIETRELYLEFDARYSTAIINCGDIIAQNANRFTRQPKKGHLPKITEDIYEINQLIDDLYHQLILGMTFILSFLTILRETNCYFIVGNHDSIIFDDMFEMEMTGNENRRINKKFYLLKRTQPNLLKKIYNGNIDRYIRTTKLRDLFYLRVEVLNDFTDTTYIFQYGLMNIPLDASTRDLDVRGKIGKTTILYLQIYECNIAINKLMNLYPSITPQTDLNELRSVFKSEYSERMKNERIILVLGHTPKYELLMNKMSYIDHNLDKLKRMTIDEEIEIRNDTYKSNINHLSRVDPFNTIISLDNEGNSSINEWLRKYKRIGKVSIPFFKGGFIQKHIVILILLIIITIILSMNMDFDVHTTVGDS